MKFVLIFFAGLCLYISSLAQNLKFDSVLKAKPTKVEKFDFDSVAKMRLFEKFEPRGGNKLKVSLVNDSLSVTDKGMLVPLTGISSLDSLMKRLPHPETLVIEFQSINGNPENILAINQVLNQCRCHITRFSLNSFDNNKKL